MKLAMRLTLDGLVNAMRWRGLAMADTKSGKRIRGDGFVSIGEAATRVVAKTEKAGAIDGK